MKKILTLCLIFLLSVSIVEAVPSLSVGWQLSSDILRPGGEATISMTFTNTGVTEVSNVFVTATLGPYLKLTSGVTELELGAISSASSQQAAMSFKIDSDAISTSTFITLKVEYYSGTSKYTKTISIPVMIRRLPILQIENVDYDQGIVPGKLTTLSFDVVNVGDGPAKDLKVKLNQTDLFILESSSGQLLIQSLGANQKETVQFPIIIDTEASVGINSIVVILDYYDESKSTTYSESSKIGAPVSGQAHFITSVDGGERFFYGSSGFAEVTVSNSGTGPAEFVTIIAESDYGLKEFYIGSLEPDDSETIDLPQDLRGVSTSYPIKLTINYRDKYQNDYSVVKNIQAVPGNAPFDYTIIIIVVVLVVIVVWYYRRTKKK